MSKYLYPIYKLKIKSYIRWWLYNYLGKFNNYVLSEILTGLSFYLEDSIDRKFNVFDIIGRTTQESTTGANLISSENIDTTIAGVTYKSQNDGTILANGEKYGGAYANFTNNIVTLENDSYSSKIFLLDGTIRKDGVHQRPSCYLVNTEDSTKTYNIGEIGNPGKTQTIEAGTYFIKIAVWSDNIVFTNAKIGLMLVKGSTIPDEFERYTGGEPAPNPNYPMAIKNTGDNGSVNEKVSNSDGTQEQNISFPLAEGQKLMEGDYLADDGVHHKWQEFNFTGSENWVLNNYSGDIQIYALEISNLKSGINYNNRFQKNIAGFYEKLDTRISGRLYIGINKNRLVSADVTGFKTWLSNNNVKGQYLIVSEDIDPYTPTQQTAWEQIKKARTYKNVTHISSEDETPAELKIQYWKEG